MIDTIPRFVVIGGALLGTVIVLMVVSALVSRVFVARSIRRLLASIGKENLPNFDGGSIGHLPPPIQRYLHFALRDGQPNIRYGVVQQFAQFRHGEGRPWFSVRATEYISGMEPGFVWDAVLRHRWYWWRTAVLGYFRGKGRGHIKLFGAVTLQDVDGPETDASMLFRFLSELVWVPTGLLPTRTLRWEAMDDRRARAVIDDGHTNVTAIFHVNAIGEIDRIVTTDKYRDLKSGFEQLPFTLECGEYREFDGVMIPTQVRFVWNLERGDFTYGQFDVDTIQYHYD